MSLKDRIRSGAPLHIGRVAVDTTAAEVRAQSAGQDWDLVFHPRRASVRGEDKVARAFQPVHRYSTMISISRSSVGITS